MASKKVVTSAVCIIPPQEIWQPIQDIRVHHDRGFVRWPPHVNLLYPFAPNNEVENVIPMVQTAVSGLSPFQVTLAEFQHFKHSKSSYTLWLNPSPVSKVQELQLALVEALPMFDDQNTLSKPKQTKKKRQKQLQDKKNESILANMVFPSTDEINELLSELPISELDEEESEEILETAVDMLASSSSSTSNNILNDKIPSNEASSSSGDPKVKWKGPQASKWGLFTPHMSVGQWEKSSEMNDKKDQFIAAWKPLEMTVDRVHIITRIGTEPFHVRYSVLFDGTVIPVNPVREPASVPPELQAFVRGLPFDTTLLKFTEWFKTALPDILLAECLLLKKPDGKLRGYGFIGLSNQEQFTAVMAASERGLFMADRQIFIAPSKKKG